MKPNVYIETSVFSVLVARPTANPDAAKRQRTTRLWWHKDAKNFTLCASDAVRLEASRGDPEIAALRLAYIDSVPTLSATTPAFDLAYSLIEAGVLPPKAHTDALHLSIALIHRFQFLLTWNCRHLANPQILTRVMRFLVNSGYNPLIVCTPDQLPKVPHE